jgi:hypothetical protein
MLQSLFSLVRSLGHLTTKKSEVKRQKLEVENYKSKVKLP